LYALARADVGEEVEGAAEGQVERDVALANGRGEGTFERNVVPLDTGNGLVGDDGLAVFEGGRDIHRLPLDGCIGGGEDVLYRLRDLISQSAVLPLA